MNSEQIFNRLTPVFPPEQAEALTFLVEEIRSDHVTRTDFSELKDLVRDLAISQNELAGAQQRTEQRVEQLAEAQERTEQRVEQLAAAQERTEHRVEQLAGAQERTESALRQLARQVGGLSEAVGGSLEDFAVDIVPELLEKHWDLHILSAEPEEIALGGATYPFDLVVRGTLGDRPILVLAETKSNVTASEVDKFHKHVERYKKHHPSEEVRMLFFGFRADRAAKERIAVLGGCMVFTRGVMFPPPQ